MLTETTSTAVRVLHRVRVEGTSAAADRLRTLLSKCGFTLVVDSSADFTIEFAEGEQLTLDCVASAFEHRLEANLEELDARFPGCGRYLKHRAGGNQDPDRCIVTVPKVLSEGVALALLRAVLQISESPPAASIAAAPVAPWRPKPWWKVWAVLLLFVASPLFAQQAPPFQQLDADTGAPVSPRVYVGLFTAASGGATAVPLPTALGTSGGIKVSCVDGCSGGGGGGATIGAAVPATASAVAVKDNSGNLAYPSLDASGNLLVAVTGAGSGGTSSTDGAGYTAGTTAGTPAMGARDDTGTTACAEDKVCIARLTSARALMIDGSATTQPISASSLPLPTGASTAAKQPALGTAGSASTDVITVQGIASMTKLLVTPDSVALPANQSVNVAQLAGTATSVNSGNKDAGTLRVTLATDQVQLTNALKVDASATTQPVSGTLGATQSGTWTVQPGNTANTTAWLVSQGAAANTATTLQSAVTANGNGTLMTVGGSSRAILTVNCATCAGGTGVLFEGTEDGTNFASIVGYQLGTSATFATNTTTAGVTIWSLPVAGLVSVRARVFSYSSGTITVTGHVTGADDVAFGTMVVNPSGSSLATSLNNVNGGTANAFGNGGQGTTTLRVTVASDSTGQLKQTDGTTVVLTDPCQGVTKTSTTVNMVTATTTRIVAPTAAKKTYICSIFLFAAGTDNVGIIEGTGGTCGTGTAGVIGGATAVTGLQLTAQTGFTLGNGASFVAATAGTNVDFCLITSAAVQLSGVVTWVQQ